MKWVLWPNQGFLPDGAERTKGVDLVELELDGGQLHTTVIPFLPLAGTISQPPGLVRIEAAFPGPSGWGFLLTEIDARPRSTTFVGVRSTPSGFEISGRQEFPMDHMRATGSNLDRSAAGVFIGAYTRLRMRTDGVVEPQQACPDGDLEGVQGAYTAHPGGLSAHLRCFDSNGVHSQVGQAWWSVAGEEEVELTRPGHSAVPVPWTSILPADVQMLPLGQEVILFTKNGRFIAIEEPAGTP